VQFRHGRATVICSMLLGTVPKVRERFGASLRGTPQVRLTALEIFPSGGGDGALASGIAVSFASNDDALRLR
jgi:hypothetical protein